MVGSSQCQRMRSWTCALGRSLQRFSFSVSDHSFQLTERRRVQWVPSSSDCGRVTLVLYRCDLKVAEMIVCRKYQFIRRAVPSLLRAWIHFSRAPDQFVASPLCLVGYVRWDARSDRVPPLQTIIFSSFTGRTSSSRAPSLAPSPLRTGLEGFPFIRLEHSKTPP